MNLLHALPSMQSMAHPHPGSIADPQHTLAMSRR